MPDPTDMRRIAFMNQKGGVGKTTSTVNIAAGMARAGRRVLLVDLDPQAHATLHLGVDPDSHLEGGSVYDTLLDPDFNVLGAIHSVDAGLGLLPAETALAAAETELANVEDRHHRLSNALTRLDGMFDDIVIDCPPSLGLLTLNGLCAAREVIIPMQAHFLALQGVGKLFETVLLVQSSSNPTLTVSGIILCMHDSQTTHTQEVVADLEGFLESQRDEAVPWNRAVVFQPPVRRNIKLAECPSFGQTIFDYAPTAAGAEDYRAIVAAVLAHAPTRPTSSTPQVHVMPGVTGHMSDATLTDQANA